MPQKGKKGPNFEHFERKNRENPQKLTIFEKIPNPFHEALAVK
jgi:hypothetical protein